MLLFELSVVCKVKDYVELRVDYRPSHYIVDGATCFSCCVSI